MTQLIFPTGFDEKTTIAQNDMILMADSEDDNKIKKAKYSNLKGDKGDTGAAGADGKDGKDGKDGVDGAAATITVGSTTTGAAGTSASVTNSGTSSAAVLDFVIPQGADGADGKDGVDGQDGAAATISVGTTTTGNPGTNASVTNSGTSSAAVFNFTIPQGATGATGNGIASITSSKSGKITTVTITETGGDVDTFQISDGADGQGSGDVEGPASSTDGHLAVFDGVTGKLIKDGGAIPTQEQADWNEADNTKADYIKNKPTLGTAAVCNTGTSSGNVPVLDSNGKLATTILPGVALTDTFTVSTSSDLTSLSSAEQGDLAIATSENKTYVLAADPYSTAANWKEILSPTGGVTSVNGNTGAVTLDADDISDTGTTHKFVTTSDKSTWNGKQNAIDANNKLNADYISNGTNNRVVYSGSSAPNTPAEGDLWYDTTNDVLKSYDGSQWNECGGGGDIEIGYNLRWMDSDMQGPCEVGFHVPTDTEITNLITAGQTLGAYTSYGKDFAGYIKIPRQNSTNLYHFTSKNGELIDTNWGFRLTNSNNSKKEAGKIRPFANAPVIPDNTWTVIYDGSSIATWAGIFWEETQGLISVSADGSTWYTLADKNVGATYIFDSNHFGEDDYCGYTFYFGNNYGFKSTDTTSTNQRYYVPADIKPSTFYYGVRCSASIPSYQNIQTGSCDNLWGYITQATYEKKLVATQIITLPDLDADDIPDSTTTHKFVTSSNKKNWDGKQDKILWGEGLGYKSVTRKDTSGPCPNGYHVPLKSEFDSLISIMTALSINTTSDYNSKLKMPSAGRITSGGWKQNAGEYKASSINNHISSIILTITDTPRASTTSYVGNGHPIRPFKDVSVVPDSSWTTIYDGSSIAAGAGIFHNTTEGLISLSSDGTNWLTIADKNLGAKVVYNVGDTLSEANCGGYFQWGNNYMFPFTGPTTTDGNRVNAYAYGPGNYYNSSTFITASNYWFEDSSPYCDNLWGGVTNGTFTDMAMSNTGTLSVNGQGGNVTVNEPIVSSTAPSSPVKGTLWYDTTNDVLKTYDGTNWNEVGSGGGGTGDIAYSQFEGVSATSGATLTISNLTTTFTPTEDFTISAGTVKEGMQYIVRITTGATAYTMSLGTGVSNPFGETLTLTASKTTTLVFLATSSSTLELFSARTAS